MWNQKSKMHLRLLPLRNRLPDGLAVHNSLHVAIHLSSTTPVLNRVQSEVGRLPELEALRLAAVAAEQPGWEDAKKTMEWDEDGHEVEAVPLTDGEDG